MATFTFFKNTKYLSHLINTKELKARKSCSDKSAYSVRYHQGRPEVIFQPIHFLNQLLREEPGIKHGKRV